MPKRPSPDSVICIDLTEDDDEREKNLDDVRKRLKGTPAANNAATVKMEGAPRAKASNDGGGSTAQEEFASEVEVVEPVAPEIHAVAQAAASSDNDDVILVGTANENRLPHMRQHCPDNNFVQDVVALNRSSHMTAVKRRELEQGRKDNVKCCDKCYCFVCDKPASECTSWGTAGQANYSSHCHASDTGNDARIWKNKRNNAKNGGAAAMRLPPQPPRRPLIAAPRTQGPHGSGPFPPDNTLAASSRNLTQCRKCGWYNRFPHRNFTANAHDYSWMHKSNPVGHLDWCHSCGRIASVRDFGKVQSRPYSRTTGDVFLGEKVIPFTIVAHDPRQMEKYKDQYEANEGLDPRWTFSEQEAEEDFFRHRLGEYPRIEMILESISVLDKIPKNTSNAEKETFKIHYTSDFEKDGTDDPGYDPDNYDEDGYREETLSFDVNPDECEAIVLENPGDVALFEELHGFGTIAAKKHKRDERRAITPYLGGDIVAKWNRQNQSGTFTVRIFIQSRLFSNADPAHRASLSRFLGTWFNIFPFSLSDISGLITAEECKAPEKSRWEDVADFARRDAAFRKVSDEMANEVQQHNAAVEAKCDQLSLNSSADCAVLGGVCSVETELEGVLKRYFRECFAQDVCDTRSYSASGPKSWTDRGRGLVSRHRSLRTSANASPDPRNTRYGRFRDLNNFRSCLSDKDQVLVTNLENGCVELNNKTKSLKGMLDHLENLHHPPVPFVEGLNIELLAFQRQSVQWALERETTPGGVQSFLWAKLPNVAESGTDVYYSPILERFRRDKPRLVRGGLICEEMGLGKTVISLALILQNPAPAVPQSGSAIAVLNNATGAATSTAAAEDRQTWDKDLYAKTSTSNDKRGSIISRGTLVVCHVSLVGQWIDEAKSKLSDPGLVYPYHGQSRKRNAATLAQNAIVVTTYQTLASDATYHAKKGGDDYCAPCEQVRWWRIICDESHSLREASTKKSMAVMNLVADHKWLVSGTPVNTTFKDLKNQLKFIGIEHVDEMFNVFNTTALKHANDPGRTQKRGRMSSQDNRSFGHFMFLLRCIMIRHTHNQTYRGTTTTLMSLPPKTERTVEVEFNEAEKEEYDALDKSALDFYTNFKDQQGSQISRHYLLLTQKLMPLRIAASGGHIPLDDEEGKAPEADGEEEEKVQDADEESDDDSEDESLEQKKKKAKKEKRYSEFSYKSKLKALIAELETARDEDENAKSLVFSQFTSTLEWLQRELPKHGFQYRTLSGSMSMKQRAKALNDFQNDPPTTIFLLSMNAGAVGINLTQANKVFLMEPCFNPALEAQAIGRVHRLGQKRNVEIVRFIMKDSVETRITKMLKNKYSDSAPTEPEQANTKRKTKRAVAALVGSIHTDRASVVGAEFDILFGAESPKEETEKVEPDAAMLYEALMKETAEEEPDAVMSASI